MNMVYFSIYQCPLWFLSPVFYSFIYIGLKLNNEKTHKGPSLGLSIAGNKWSLISFCSPHTSPLHKLSFFHGMSSSFLSLSEKWKWKKVNVTQSCLSSLPGSCLRGILQARTLEWVAVPFSRWSSPQGLNPGLPHRRWILYCLSHQASLCQKTAIYSLRLKPKGHLFQNYPDHPWRFQNTFFWGIIHEDNSSGNYLITRQPSSFNQILQTYSIPCLHILFPQTDITNQP